ncbi:MAG TPA: hypothetical protein VGH19_11875 [Verrucomicrobiae bacterium]
MKLTEQSELKLETGCRPVSRRYRKVSQANWWFGQMRRAVEQACPTGMKNEEGKHRTSNIEL